MLEILRARRSIRKFKQKPVKQDTVEILKEVLLRSPSSRGVNPWEFFLVDDPLILKNLSLAKKHGSEFLENAPLGIVVCGDQDKSDVWVEDCSIASVIVQLTAQSEGLGSCWVQIRNRKHDQEVWAEEYVRDILNLPYNLKVECIIGIGYPDEEPTPHRAGELDYKKVHTIGSAEL